MNVYGMPRRQYQRLWMVALLGCSALFACLAGCAAYALNAELKLQANLAETCASVSGARTVKEDRKLSYDLKYTFTPTAGEVMVAETWQSLGAAAWQGALDRGCVAVVYDREDPSNHHLKDRDVYDEMLKLILLAVVFAPIGLGGVYLIRWFARTPVWRLARADDDAWLLKNEDKERVLKLDRIVRVRLLRNPPASIDLPWSFGMDVLRLVADDKEAVYVGADRKEPTNSPLAQRGIDLLIQRGLLDPKRASSVRARLLRVPGWRSH